MISKHSYFDISESHFFRPNSSPHVARVLNPSSWTSKVVRSTEYQLRAYYEYLNCTQSGGKVYYYTFTYNDDNLPMWKGKPVFSNKDIRWFVHDSIFRNVVKKEMRCNFRYFFTKEYGDLHGRPHYHALLYLYPLDSSVKMPTPKEFDTLVKRVWQGDAADPQDFRKGIVKCGSLGPEVLDSRAAIYCCKYVVKSLAWTSVEQYARDILRDYAHEQFVVGEVDDEDEAFHDSFSEWKNEYGARPRCSKSFGACALSMTNPDGSLLIDPFDPHFLLPSSSGWRSVPFGLYYYRKLYQNYTIYKGPRGNDQVHYYLNERGVAAREKHITDSIMRDASTARSLVQSFRDSPDIHLPFAQSLVDKLDDDVFYTYALYRNIYFDRLYYTDNPPQIDPYKDYIFYLSHHYEESTAPIIAYSPYRDHPRFMSYITLFNIIDWLESYFFSIGDRKLYDESLKESRKREFAKYNINL
ncbi:replication initiator protein [Capybara microvirus Cap3_SP_407]|nr:replication initiator protein [Capybara microvirus Cap3_SP_407]